MPSRVKKPEHELIGPEKPTELTSVALQTSTKWFEIHAAQRLEMFRFFVTLFGFSVAGSAAAIENKLKFISSSLGALIVSSAICFKLLDRRTAQLVKHGEQAMQVITTRMANELGDSRLDLIARAEEKNGVPSYRQVFGLMFWFCAIIGLIFFFYPWVSG